MLWNRPTLLVLTISLILFARVFIIEVITIVFVSRKNKACAQLPASEPNLCIILSIQHRVLLRATVSKGSFVLQGLVLGSLHVATRVLSAAYRFQYAMHNFNTINEPSTSPMRQVTSQSGASFKFSLQFQHLGSIDQPSGTELYLSTLKNLLLDVFPYFRVTSATFVLALLEVAIFLMVDPSRTVIKPYKGFNDLLPWVFSALSPIQILADNGSNLTTVICHVLFLMSVGAELEYKLNNINRFLVVYIVPVIVSNLFLHLIWAPHIALCCNNLATYSLYCCLLFQKYSHMSTEMGKSSPGLDGYTESYDYTYRSGIESMEVDKAEESEKDQKVVRIYKVMVLSYLVLQASYKQDCYFCAYVVASLVQTSLAYLGAL